VKKAGSATDPLWYKDAVIYELHVRAFQDSNGDGIGDFGGLLTRLDYLQDLGVTCLWLLPFFPSPLRDDGYDIANYVDVNPSYGTLNDFKQFLDAAHQRNMQVMIELVINHTSDQHPWFQAAIKSPEGSPEREMYVWSDTDKLYEGVRIIFTDTEKSNWTWDETAQQFYWHRFFSHQPDLNFDNPRVMDEVLKAMRFWLDMGVDALRLDAIPYLIERDGTSCENVPETHVKIKQIRAVIDAEYDNRLILAEANMWPADVRPYLGDGDECHMAFHFPLMPRIYMALRQEDRLPITDIMAQTPAIPDNCQWGLFLRNHDELTLEMVTNDERDYMYLAYSADPRMRINVGIRRRLAPLLDNNRRRIELLNSLLFSFPGTPILYYGDEIGMGDNIYLGDRNGVRTPMQWTSDRNAGFSRAVPARLYAPVIMDPIWGYEAINVEAQLTDQSSLLHWTRNMIALRKLFKVFGRGTQEFLAPDNRKVLAYIRQYTADDGTSETVLCVANLSRFAQPVSLDLSRFAGMVPVEMLGYVSFPPIDKTPYALSLSPYSFLWLELQPAPEVPEPPAVETEEAILDLTTGSWHDLLVAPGLSLLQDLLPAYLVRQRWFGAKSRTISSVRVLDWVELPALTQGKGIAFPAEAVIPTPKEGVIPPSKEAVISTGASQSHRDAQRRDPRISHEAPQPLNAALVFLEITYADAASSDTPPDIYQLPLALTTGFDADAIRANSPASILASLSTANGPAILHDATAREDVRQVLLSLIETGATLSGANKNPESTRTAATPPEALSAPRDEDPLDAARVGESMGLDSSGGAPPGGSMGLQPHETILQQQGALAPGSSLTGHKSTAFDDARGTGPLPARTGAAEQSNTSILYDGKLILKLFRRLQPGENPDTEIGRFLTEVAHFPRVAPFLGDIRGSRNGIQTEQTPASEQTTLAMLQALIENEGDGWQFTLDELARYYEAVVTCPPPKDVGAPPSFLNKSGTDPLPADAREHAGLYLEAAALLGRRTAEMHLALATSTHGLAPEIVAAFEPEPFTAESLAADTARIHTQIARGLDALKHGFTNLPDELTTDSAALILSRRIELFSRARAIAEVPPKDAGQRIRIHGDYHLGQVLRARGDYVILDFEGEPARTLAERRAKQSPLRDVAGMLRSFSYAAYGALDHFTQRRPGTAKALESWAQLWQNAVSGEFLNAWRTTVASNPHLIPQPPQAHRMLNAYLLEKALYELLYELNNRPAWVRIPLAGILALPH
jgi:maltose alpha-D-glucosyltransferase / alpha-amylase